MGAPAGELRRRCRRRRRDGRSRAGWGRSRAPSPPRRAPAPRPSRTRAAWKRRRSRTGRRRACPPRRRSASGCDVGRRHQRLVGHVEPDHRHVEPAREHPVRRLGVGPDVELGRRRGVALADRAAHQHDALELGRQLRVAGQEQRHVGERSGRDERDGRRCSLRARGRSSRSRARARALGPGGGRSGPSSPVSPCTSAATCRARISGRAAPAATGTSSRPEVVEHADRVGGRLLQRLVTGHGGHAEQPDLGAGQREQQRDRVVVAGVAVEDDVGHALRIASRRPVLLSERESALADQLQLQRLRDHDRIERGNDLSAATARG